MNEASSALPVRRVSIINRMLWILPLIAGTAITWFGYQHVDRTEQRFLQQSIEQRAALQTTLIRSILEDHVISTREIAALAEAELNIETSFKPAHQRALAQSIRKLHPEELLGIGIFSLDAIPRNTRNIQADAGSFDPAVTRADLQKAIKHDITLRLLKNSRNSWVIRHIHTLDTSRHHLVISDWNITRLIYLALTQTQINGFNIEISARQNGQSILLYESRNQGEPMLSSPWVVQHDFDISSVRCHVRTIPLKSWVEQNISKMSRLVLLLGMLVTLMFTLFLLNRNRNIDMLNRKVHEQTRTLELQHRELASVIDHSTDAVLITDHQGMILRANPAAHALFGYAADAWPELSMHDLLPEQAWRQFQPLFNGHEDSTKATLVSHTQQFSIRTQHGELIPCECHIESFLAGEQQRFSITLRDISEHLVREWSAQTLLQLRKISQQPAPLPERMQEMLELLFDEPWHVLAGSGGLYIHDGDHFTLIASHGWNAEERENRHMLVNGTCIHCKPMLNKQAGMCPNNLDASLGQFFCLQVVHQGERLAVMHLQLRPNVEPPAEFIDLMSHLEEVFALMITSYRAEENLTQLSYYDALTDLPNRRLFLDRLHHAIAMAKREKDHLAVLFMDLNRFKLVNDTLGHEAGDEVLKQTAQRFRRFLRESDTAARLGGDEFAVLLPKASGDTALSVAKKILFSLQEPIHLPQQDVTIGTSIGIASYPDDGEDADTLLKHADAAMYHAKKNHSDIHYFSGEIEEEARRILALEQDLSQIVDKGALKLHYLAKAGAMTHDDSDAVFPVYYQSKHCLSDNRINGFESLVRWNHPVLGMVQPSEFIHLAEETGYIRPISDWIMFKSCLQARAWEEQGLRAGRIAVNISAVQLMNETLAKEIIGIIKKAGAKPEWMEIEITETAAMHDPAIATCIMQQLADAGAAISIDDFGTGYSSLSYLKRFPANTLKIDREFIKDLPDDAEDCAIVRSTIAMAHALGMKVIAEGVETEAQLQFLKGEGCDEAQGFLFTQPMTADEMAELVRKQQSG